ncbi:MAG: hypothetical protein WBG57_12825, partial [Ornithinimicrobium sp.]
LGGGLVLAARRLPARATVATVAAYCIVVAAAAAGTAWYRSPDALPSQRATTEAVLAAPGPAVTVQSIGAPAPLVLGGETNPIRHQMFLTGLAEYVDETEPGGLAAVAADIERRRPTFVTMDEPDWYEWVMPTIDRNYRLIGRRNGVTWFADRDLSEPVLAEMTRILARDS